jgi:hypothetical protein
MQRFYSKATGTTYLEGMHNDIPDDAVPIDAGRYLEVIANPAPGRVRSHDAQGLPILIDPPPYVPTTVALCACIDRAADAARRSVAGDPLRAVEYERSAAEAQAFKDAGYPAEAVPRTVSAWAINGRTVRQAADSILTEAATYSEALYLIRETRLQAKEQIRVAMGSGNTEQAQSVAAASIAAIAAAVSGVGNNTEAN